MKSVDEAAAALGLNLVWEASTAARPEVYLWPENVKAWNLFLDCSTQWVVGVDGPTGLSYPGVEAVMRIEGIKSSKRRVMFSKIRVMERAMLNAWSEKKNG